MLLCMNVLPTVSSEPSNGASLSLRHVAALIDRLGRAISACFGRAGMLRSLHAYSMTAGCKSTGCLWCQTSHCGAASSALETARLAQACLPDLGVLGVQADISQHVVYCLLLSKHRLEPTNQFFAIRD